jgi:hypothetical protein
MKGTSRQIRALLPALTLGVWGDREKFLSTDDQRGKPAARS